MKAFWDERYRSTAYVYGEAPNVFFEERLRLHNPGLILMPAEGEGRNAVHAASQGWAVHAFDQSIEGQRKAALLAQKYGVDLDYKVGDFEEMEYPASVYDAIGLIYVHFPSEKRSIFHELLDTTLKPGGVVIFEAFNIQHIAYVARNPGVGGPRDMDLLYSKEELLRDFSDYEIIELWEGEVVLREGQFHDGTGSVLRLVARKPLG